jgi:hypothetical protein
LAQAETLKAAAIASAGQSIGSGMARAGADIGAGMSDAGWQIQRGLKRQAQALNRLELMSAKGFPSMLGLSKQPQPICAKEWKHEHEAWKSKREWPRRRILKTWLWLEKFTKSRPLIAQPISKRDTKS